MSEIFILTGAQKLVALTNQPYASEDLLQSLLADYPNLLAGDQIDPVSPRRWLLVKREAPVPGEDNGGGRWSLDHLFLDQEGVPTLVEVKRSTDTRIRREVVGQMLDYAANGVKYWPAESLRSAFEQTCDDAGVDAQEALAGLIGVDADPTHFWTNVKTNLKAGRIRMLFVADEIPEELQRVVEFLNEQMDPAEVLAVEIKQFVSPTMKTLVPRVIGKTAEAEDRKRVGSNREKRQWDEATYFAELQTRHGAGVAQIARRLLEWAKERTTYVWWGQGLQNGSFVPMRVVDGVKYHLWAAYNGGAEGRPSVEMYFQHWIERPPFDQLAVRQEMRRRLNAIPGVVIPESGLDKRPSFPLERLAPPESMAAFLATMQWFLDQVPNPIASHHGP